MEIREYYQSKLKKSFLLTISIFVICSLFVFNSQAIAQIQSPPDPPTNLLAAGASSIQVNISWTTPSNNGGSITGYKIEYKIGSGDYSVLVANTTTTATSYAHTGLSANTTYTYRVSAISPTGTSIPSNEATATTMTDYFPPSPTDPPNPPINLGAHADLSTQITISWGIPVSTIGLYTGYKIEYKIGSGDYSVLVANTANTNTEYVHTGLTLGTTYTYRVSTISSTGTSIPSNEATATTFSSPTTPSPSTGPPDPPTNLLAAGASSTQINISWTTPSNNGGFVTGYKIEYKIGSGDYSVLVANTANTNTWYVHTGLTLGTTYTYRVSTISPTGTSIPSNEASAITQAVVTTMSNPPQSQPTPVTTQPTQSIPAQPTPATTQSTPTTPTTIVNATPQELASIDSARNSQTIAAEINIVNQAAQTTSIDNNVSVMTDSTTSDSFGISVTAPSQTGPKVIAINLAATTIDVANLNELGVMYDGVPILPATDIDSILHAKSTDNPSFAIVVTQSGAQILISVPHFSTHSITITNLSKVIPAVPEFSFAGPILLISFASVIVFYRIKIRK